MDILKKITFVVMLMISSSTFATTITTDAYKAPSSCKMIVDYGQKIAENNDALKDSDFLLSNFIACNLEVMPKSITTDALYSIFGSNITWSLNFINDFASSLFPKIIENSDIDKTTIDNYMKGRIHTFPILTEIIRSFSVAVSYVLSSLILVFMTYYIASSMNDGSYLGKSHNAFWTSSKNILIFMLIMPLNGIGLNAIQLFMIALAFAGSFLANIIWSILPMFKYLYLTDFDDVSSELKGSLSTNSQSIVYDLVASNMCDISMRQNILLSDSPENYTSDIISNNKFYNCLNANIQNTNPSLSDSIFKTQFCASQKEVSYKVDCGTVLFNTQDKALEQEIKDTIYPKARIIAQKIIASNCAKNVDLKMGNPSLYFKYCSNVDNISFGEKYDGKTIISQYQGGSNYNPNSDVQALASSLTGAIESDIKTEIVSDSKIKKLITENISFALNKGWLNAGTFLFDVGATTNMKEYVYEKSLKSLEFKYPNYKANDVTTSMAGSAYSNNYSDLPVKGLIYSMNTDKDLFNIFMINNDLKSLGITTDLIALKESQNKEVEAKTESSTINDYLFPTLRVVEEFNRSKNPTSNEKCYSDYSNCKEIPVNPIASLLDVSRGAMKYSTVVVGLSAIMDGQLNKFIALRDMQVKKGEIGAGYSTSYFFATAASLVLQLIQLIMSIQTVFFLIVGYLLPIILFIYFIGNAISWLITVVFSVIGSTVWLAVHLIPSQDDSFAGHAKKGYLMLMDVLLKPAFIVVGVFCTFILTIIMLVILNTSFGVVLNTFSFFEDPNAVTQVFYNFVLNMIYLIFLIWIFFKSAKATYKIPNALEKWIGLVAYQDASLWREISTLAEKTFLTGIKKYLILT